MRAFPEQLPQDERVLFRLETERASGVLTLLVQSITRPDWSWLDPEDGYLLDLGRELNPWIKSFDSDFQAGQPLAFRLRANPTVKRDGKRHGLFREEDQVAWLERKAAAGGFELAAVRSQQVDELQGYTAQRHHLKMLAVQFDGLLRVTDPEAFIDTLQRGIGPGKGLGFGLLSVARPA